MQKRTIRITAVRRAAIAGAASTALIAGMIAPAGAQPAENPVMSEAPEAPAASSIENLPQLPGSGPAPEVPEVPELPVTPEVPVNDLIGTGERVQVGENIRAEDKGTLFWKSDGYEVSLHKQVTAGQEAYPGDMVAVRMQVDGHWKHARLLDMSNHMPAGFEFVSVARVTVGEEGENPAALEEGQYEVIEREDGSTDVKVGGINQRVSADQTYTLDFLYRAPENVGTYEHGGSASFVTDSKDRLGDDNARSFSADTGGQPIIVKERPVIPEPPVVDPEDPTGSIDWGSIDLGSLGDLSSSSEDEPADEPGETPAQ